MTRLRLTCVCSLMVVTACGAGVVRPSSDGVATSHGTGGPYAAPSSVDGATSRPQESGPSSTRTTPPSRSTSTTVRSASGAQAIAAAASPAPRGSSRAPTLPSGTYHYAQSGSQTFNGTTRSVPAVGVFKIDPVTTGGSQSWHWAVDPSQPPSDRTFLYERGGVFLTHDVERVTGNGTTLSFSCAFSPPMASPPWPPTAGSAFSGHGDCSTFTVDLSGRISGTREVRIGSTDRNVFVVETSVTTHGQVESAGSESDWIDPTDDMPVHIQISQRGTYAGAFPFSSSIVADLLQ